jgi:hypothetical protein
LIRLALALAIALVVAAVAPARADLGAVSPGPLARPHARLEAQCSLCHVPFGGVPATLCLACHAPLAARIARGVGFHPSVRSQPCTACHREHRGREAALMPEPVAAFDHRSTAFPLEGDHAQLACDRCHGKPGARRWVGLPTTCQSCHADRAHHGALGSDCARCHRARGWSPPSYPAADHRIAMTGGHARLDCVACHKSGLHLAARPACAQCHAQPHAGTQAACETCHRVAAWNQVSFTHRFPASALPGKHQAAPCLACHPAFRFAPTPFECAACHDQDRPHEPLGGCADCHTALSWQAPTFDHDRPAIGFALTGRHRAVACASCHTQRGSFRGAARACGSCHADPHRGQLAAGRTRAAASAPWFRGPAVLAPLAGTVAANACAECHTTAGWRPSTISVASHADFGYPLRDAHARAACTSCHAAGKFAGTSRTCAGCHADVRHKGRFGADCATCHGERAWSPAAAFDHRRTGFPLDHGHARPACRACHGADGLRLARVVAPTGCATCHTGARHGRQLGPRCTDCHSTKSFREVPPFDHAARTDFPLELRHATLPCLACHDARQRPVVNLACRTCHGDPHRGSNAVDCLDCHRPDRWRIIRFDHDLTAHPLVGRHRIAACGRCHTNPSWTGVRTDCVACHALDRPRTQDHLTKVTCDDCHTAISWRQIRE